MSDRGEMMGFDALLQSLLQMFGFLGLLGWVVFLQIRQMQAEQAKVAENAALHDEQETRAKAIKNDITSMFQRQYEALVDHHNRVQDRLQATTREFALYQGRTDAQIDHLKNENENVKNGLSRATAEALSFKKLSDETEANMQQVKERVFVLEGKMEELQKRLEQETREKERALREKERAQEQLLDLQANISRKIQEEMKPLHDRIRFLETEINARDAMIAALEARLEGRGDIENDEDA